MQLLGHKLNECLRDRRTGGQEDRSDFYLFASIFAFFLQHLFLFEKHILMNKIDDDKKSIDKIIEGEMNHWCAIILTF